MDTAGIDLIKGMAMGRLIDFLYPIPIAGLLTLLAKENFLSRAFMRLFKDSALAYFMARGIFGENPQACEVEFQREMTISTPIPSIAMGLKACLDYHAEDHLPRVDIPVLVMVGTRDIFTKRRAVTETCELLPDARCQVYKGAGHNPLLERPEQVNKDLEVFLEECFEKSQLKKAV
jgi:pimeloyl-ACP methyl ester carboxylesterase